jgi:hypothetical protein
MLTHTRSGIILTIAQNSHFPVSDPGEITWSRQKAAMAQEWSANCSSRMGVHICTVGKLSEAAVFVKECKSLIEKWIIALKTHVRFH